MSEADPLTPVEKRAIALLRATNTKPALKRMQYLFLRQITNRWIRTISERRVYVDNVEHLIDPPERGVLLAANHRSFFDQYACMLSLYDSGADWPQRIYFPVRSNFFYEGMSGVLINFLIGGGTMYPPIFRDPSKAHLNKVALDDIRDFLALPNTLVGVHPEGTRGKGPDPYELLKAQPGIGQMVLQAQPIVVPAFVNGMGNSVGGLAMDARKPNARRDPIVVVFGEPLDYSEFTEMKPRASVYLRLANKIRSAIIDLIPREKELRAKAAAGEISDDHPAWLANRYKQARG